MHLKKAINETDIHHIWKNNMSAVTKGIILNISIAKIPST